MRPDAPDIARSCSPFLDRLVDRHPDWYEQLESAGRLDADRPPKAEALVTEISDHGLDSGLRRFRNREMMRIIWRELDQRATLEQTMGDLSRLAEHSLQAALDHHAEAMRERFGVPVDASGRELRLVVLGLGKLGGRELNLSSDIDIVFCFARGGRTDGQRKLDAEQYFLRLARAMVRSLNEVTEDGFCFRVDTRLRPFGEAGPLVCSFGAMEQYYQREGRDWERYALVKCRPVAGDLEAGERLLLRLKPFVYRRYIDYGAVEALQDMLGSIREDAARSGRETDIKRGPGGIREVEFLVQCVQLLRGGREPQLQTPSLLEALRQMQRLGVLPDTRVTALREYYAFLRRVENAIQALHDQQTHTLPVGEDLARVVRATGFDSKAVFLERLAAVRSKVSQLLETSFPRAEGDASPPAWEETLGPALGVAGEVMDAFRTRLARTALSQRATQRLNRFMPLFFHQVAAAKAPIDVQRDLMELVLTVCRRSAYLALLVQNPRALERLVELFLASDWIAAAVIRHPALLDELIDPALGRALPDAEELATNSRRILAAHQDVESAVQGLNYMKLACSLRIAVAELEQAVDAVRVQDMLTELAEVLVEACLSLATHGVENRHGRLPPPGLGVIAYGSLGARDTGYASDLDLIFLYEAVDTESDGDRPLLPEQYYTRLARRMLSLATTVSPAGRLYEVDTRLRPNGRAGLLVSSLTSFQRYQANEAWVWELQALVRARPVAGDADVARRFGDIRRAVLGVARDHRELRAEVAAMRERMRAEGPLEDPFKHGPGGLVDIDFVAQLGVLQFACEDPTLLDATGTREQLDRLVRSGWVNHDEARVLTTTHQSLVHARQLTALSRSGRVETPDCSASREICERLLQG